MDYEKEIKKLKEIIDNQQSEILKLKAAVDYDSIYQYVYDRKQCEASVFNRTYENLKNLRRHHLS